MAKLIKGLKVGDRVRCQLYNTPERLFYGEPWVGEIVSIDDEGKPWRLTEPGYTGKPYEVTRPNYGAIQLHPWEIRGRA